MAAAAWPEAIHLLTSWHAAMFYQERQDLHVLPTNHNFGCLQERLGPPQVVDSALAVPRPPQVGFGFMLGCCKVKDHSYITAYQHYTAICLIRLQPQRSCGHLASTTAVVIVQARPVRTQLPTSS